MKSIHDIKVFPILESLAYIKANRSSVARFGDGEFDILMGRSIPYQPYSDGLAAALLAVLKTPSSPELLVCLPDVFEHLERYNSNAQHFWNNHFAHYADFYAEHCQSDWYGSTFISRPYIDLVDKSQAEIAFDSLKELWQGRDVLIVEGETSRSGVGNDLFDQAKSLERIICPPKNAFAYYDSILEAILEYSKDRLILLMLGPTAKVLAAQLSQQGFQAIDLGHIDSEYEWFKMGATHKIKLDHKHTAEFNHDDNIDYVFDNTYQNQIVARVGVAASPKKENKMNNSQTISIIVPVYNTKNYLKRCVDSILKQTYSDFELLLINDGSKDGSALLCEEFAKTDPRIAVIHQDNAGPSAARNRGLDSMTGRYVTFIDSDDFVEPDYLEKLYEQLTQNDADISVGNFNSFDESRQTFLFSIIADMYFEQTFTVEEWLNQENTAKNNLFLVFTLSFFKLFKSELFDGIRFPVGRVREDDFIMYKLYLKAKKIAFFNQGIYYYTQREDSLSHQIMQEDIVGMISNAEERLALLATLGYNLREHIDSYIKRLKKCQTDALHAGQIELYHQLSTKLDLIEHHKKEG